MDQFDQKANRNEEHEQEAVDHEINRANLYGNTPVPTVLDTNRDEETARELTADDYHKRAEKKEEKFDGSHVNSSVGWIALILSVASFFFMPIILGGIGIIAGFVARSKDADTLGTTAIIGGAASIVITLFVLPYL